MTVIRILTYVDDEFQLIEFDTKSTVCLEHMVMMIIKKRPPEFHVKFFIKLKPVVSTLKLSKNFHKKRL